MSASVRSTKPTAPVAKPFMGWSDLVVTPLVALAIFGAAALCTHALHRGRQLGVLEWLAMFFVLQTAWAVIALRVIWRIAPPREGIHVAGTTQRYLYNLTGFIVSLHLWPLVGSNTQVPPFFQQFVYAALGVRIGRGIVVIAGRIADPPLTSVGDGAIVGDGALVLAHASGVAESGDYVLLARVEIGDGAVIGARSVLMPGVRVGAHAMVQPMSLVAIHTKIPDYEVWGGVPAKKVGELRRAPASIQRASAVAVEDAA